jgi:SAM-dependent methyltransferase
VGQTGKIAFRDRKACPNCGNTHATAVWSGKYSDADVQRMLDLFAYSVDTAKALGESVFALLACNDCGLRYHSQVLDDASVSVVYSDWTDQQQIDRFHALHGVGNPVEDGIRRTKMALRMQKLAATRFAGPLRWLDFGCGNGGTLAVGRALGFEMIGVEPSATRRAEAERVGVPVFASLDAMEGELKGRFHAVSMEQVLEHLTDPLGTLRVLHERMEDGAVLHVAVPDCSGTEQPTDFDSFHKVQPIEHVNAFTPATLRSICEAAGFQPVRRPAAWVTTDAVKALRAFGGMIWEPRSTECYFRRA